MAFIPYLLSHVPKNIRRFWRVKMARNVFQNKKGRAENPKGTIPQNQKGPVRMERGQYHIARIYPFTAFNGCDR
jgi:hypothetical protein